MPYEEYAASRFSLLKSPVLFHPVGKDEFSDDLGGEYFSDDDDFSEIVPTPAERQWRHPSEMAAEARAAAAASVPSSPRPVRARGPVWITAAGLVVGIVMVGLIQSSRASSTQTPDNDVAAETPVAPALLTISSTTSPPATQTPSTAGVSTTYTSPILEDRVARPEGLLTLFASDKKTVLGSAVATENMILTSASSSAGHQKVYVSSSLGSASMWEATLLGTDGFSDLAVFTCEEPLESLNLPVRSLSEADPNEKVTVIAGGETFLTSAPSGKVLRLDTTTKSAMGYQLAGIAATSVEASDDAAGAGLFDENGDLLGIVVHTDDHLASVLPIEAALRLAHSLTTTGRITPNWAGFKGSSTLEGVVVIESIGAQSPAEEAGLLVGDIVLSVDGNRVSTMADLVHYMRSLETGSSVELGIRRDAEFVVLEVLLGRDFGAN